MHTGRWHDFFAAEMSVAATLAGLVFVGVSINFTKVIASARLPDRAFEALIVLLTNLIISSISLVPDQSDLVLGIEIAIVALPVWIVLTKMSLRNIKIVEPEYRSIAIFGALLSQFAIVPIVVSSFLTARYGALGYFFAAFGIILSLLVVFSNAWILTIEINR